ncbi:MAG: hypothetical protein ACK5V3_12770 [Bdellovibrionales bacterium]
MKKIMSIAALFMFLVGCTTMQGFTPADATSEGIRYKYGSSRGIKLGDRIIAYKRTPSNSRRGFSYIDAGTLTVTKVEKDFAIMKKDGEFEVNETTSFARE